MPSANALIAFCITCCWLFATGLTTRVSFNGFRQYRLVPLSPEAVSLIHWLDRQFPPEPRPNRGLTFLTQPSRINQTVDLLVPPAIESVFLEKVQSTPGVQMSLVHRSYGRLIARSNALNQRSRLRFKQRQRRQSEDNAQQRRQPSTLTRFTLRHDYYRTLKEIYSDLSKLNFKCNQILPGTCQLKTIGKSYLNNDLVILRISKKSAKNTTKIWLDGGIHAREWISHASLMYIADEIITNLNNKRASLVDNHEFIILPMYNPDGYEYSRLQNRMWRKNREPTARRDCTGVDLNRNYGFEWGGRGGANACASSYRGTSAFSTSETAAVKQFIESEKSGMVLFMSYHAYGQYFLVPFAHKKKTYSKTNRDRMSCAAHMAIYTMLLVNNRYYTFGTGSDLMYEANGTSDDWAHGSIGIPYSYTVELPDEGDYGFLLPAYYVPDVGHEAMVGLRALLRAIRLLTTGDPTIEEDCKRFSNSD